MPGRQCEASQVLFFQLVNELISLGIIRHTIVFTPMKIYGLSRFYGNSERQVAGSWLQRLVLLEYEQSVAGSSI